MSADALSLLTFVRQQKLAEFLTVSAARRAEIFAELFGTKRADRLYKVFTDELAACPVVQAGDEAGLLEAQLAAAEARLAALRGERAALEDDDDARAAVERARAVQEADRAARAAAAAAEARRRQLEGWMAEAGPLRAEAARLAGEAALFAAAAAGAAAGVEAARRDLEAWAAHRRWGRQAAAHAAQRAALDREAAGLVAPGVPRDEAFADSEAYAADGPRLAADLEAATRVVAAARGGLPCPTCGTPAVDLAARAEAAAGGMVALADRLGRLRAAAEVVSSYERLRPVYEQRLRSIEQRRAQLDATAPGDEVAAPTTPEADCRAAIAEAEDFRRRADDAGRRHAAAAARLESLERLIAAAATERAAEVAGPAPEDLAAAARVLEGHAERARRRAVLSGQVAELEAAVGRDRARLGRLRAELEAAARSNAWRERVEALRAVVHRDALPRLVARAHLDNLQDSIDELLERFEARFRVEVGEDLSFTARFLDGRRQPAARLSCGEKVILALAFRIAANAAFAGELALLALDEPTDSLDARNLGCLEVAIARLRELTAARGLQVILITHERKLARLCDATLDLGGWD